MKNLTKLLYLGLAPLLALQVNCAAGPEEDSSSCRGGKCDDLDLPDSEVPDTVCDGVLVDHSGRGNLKVAGRLHDPLADIVFKQGDSCPTSFADIMDKLRALDTTNCDGDARSGIATRLVSETAQATGEPTSYRSVTTRTCDGRPTHGIIFSLFGLQAGARDLPSSVEIIAFDETAGVFNYYEAEANGSISFFGNSKDLLKGKGQGQDRRCASCHTGGGLIMKELDTPWLHWEGHMDTPGAAELVDLHENLGQKRSGAEFEGLVKAGNRIWNQTRLDHLKETGAVKDILEPLFCTVEVNIDNGADFESPVEGGPGGSEVTRVPFDALFDKQLKSFGSISIKFDDYDALIKANGQRVRGVPGAIDTVFDMPFIERSHADNDYVDKMKNDGIVDEEFVKDVLMVDFTRPVFSDDRCALLEFAPVLSNDNLTADKIREGFIANLGSPAPGSPAAELLNNLLTDGGSDEKVTALIDACKALDQNDFLVNAMQIISMNRAIARTMPVFEFPATMPEDNLNVPVGSRLDPTNCQVTGSFVAVAETVEAPAECAHDECETGAKLDSSCSPCAAAVCEADSFCCAVEWNEFCSAKVEALCAPKTCEAEPPPPTNACAHAICEEGVKLDPACDDDCVATMCAPGVDPFCCNNKWDDICVSNVPTTCSPRTCQ